MIHPDTILTVFAFVFGACAGSFMNVCIWRLPRNESIVSPPSHCPKCGCNISWYENIPILSWICLRARCSKCKEPISARYILIELLTGLLFLLAWLKCMNGGHPNPSMIFPLAAVIFLAETTIFTDIEHMIIPDEITFSTLIAGLVFSIIWPWNWELSFRILDNLTYAKFHMNPYLAGFLFSLASAAAAYVAFAVFAVAGKRVFGVEALGWGDVKYMAAIGACLGIPACFFTALAGSVLGTFYGFSLIFFRKAGLRTAIPFGPFLSVGTFIWIFFDKQLIQAYMKLSQIVAASLVNAQ